jgi:hypothetical protein
MRYRSPFWTLVVALVVLATLPAAANTIGKATVTDDCTGYTISVGGQGESKVTVDYTITLTPTSGSVIAIKDSITVIPVQNTQGTWSGTKTQTWAHYSVTLNNSYTPTGTATLHPHTINITFTPSKLSCAVVPVYMIGGAVSGLSGAGLVLQSNGRDSLSVSANGTFTFPTPLANRATYAVTVHTQPSGQICSVLNGLGTVASANVTNILIVCIVPPAGGSGLLTTNGGTVSTPAAIVTAPSGATGTQQNVTVATIAPPPGLPNTLESFGAAVDISVDSPSTIDAPFLITLPYDPTGIPDENEMAVVHYNTTKMRYEPVTILSHDTTAHSFQM